MILKSTRAYAPPVTENPVNTAAKAPGISPKNKRLRTAISLLVGLGAFGMYKWDTRKHAH